MGKQISSEVREYREGEYRKYIEEFADVTEIMVLLVLLVPIIALASASLDTVTDAPTTVVATQKPGGPCHVALEGVEKGLLGSQQPQCNVDGTFKHKQCHSSTGYCWCVNTKTGQEITGTKKGPADGEVRCGGPCHVALGAVEKGLLGSQQPQCNVDGTFKHKQCHSSSGYCWCVNTKTGQEITGTKKGPADGEVRCGGPCHIALEGVEKGLLGSPVPQCNVDGTFKHKQCHSSSGYCWCVNTKTGQEISGTKKGPADGEVTCGGPCHVALGGGLLGGALLGSQEPQCNVDGTFKQKQCHSSTGYCWCVNTKTGVIIGTKKGPADGELTCDVAVVDSPQVLGAGYSAFDSAPQEQEGGEELKESPKPITAIVLSVVGVVAFVALAATVAYKRHQHTQYRWGRPEDEEKLENL